MRRHNLRLTVVTIISGLTLSFAAGQTQAQISGSSAVGGVKHVSGSIKPPGTTTPTQQTPQTQQPAQSSPAFSPVGGGSQAGINQLLQYATVSALQQQPTTLDGLMQQQVQLALVSTVQQLQMAGQVQALQLQQNAVAAAARQKQADDEARASQRHKPQTLSAEEIDQRFPKLEIKPLEQNSDDEAAARQLRMAKKLKEDADAVEFSGNRTESAKLKSKVSQRLSDIMEKYPKTSAAKEADLLIQNLYR